MAEEDLSDVWSIILRECATDCRRNMTVPGLAHVAKYRALSREIRDGAARLVTPYDATIRFAPNGRSRVPVAYCGGVHFAEVRFGKGLSIIRDRATSQMFAVSHDTAEHHSDWLGDGAPGWVYTVKRAYPLARLAQLLGGHASDWQKRLPDLFRVAFPTDERNDEGSRWSNRVSVSLRQYSLTSATRHAHQGVTAHGQLRAREWTGEPGPLTTHHDDFISHRVLRAGHYPDGIHDGFFSSFVKDRDLVMATCVNGEVHDMALLPKRLNWCGNDHSKAGIRPPSIFEVTCEQDCVHVLSRALGWDSAPRVAEGPGWLVSLLLHGRGDKYPTSMPSWPVPSEDLMEMGAMAKEVREEAEKAREKPYHPIDNPLGFDILMRARRRPRPRRAAAAVAMERMLEHEGTAINLNGSLARAARNASSSAGSDSDADCEDDVAARAAAGLPVTWYEEQVEAGGANAWHYAREEARGDVAYVQPRRKRKRKPKRAHPKVVVKARRAFRQHLVELHELLEAMREGRA